nr:hypothetical protein [Candidatus Sigynarchaeota archaeon]
MVFTESGLLAYEARFDRCEINCDLVTGFVTAINQFGCELFPHNDLCDIVFTNTRLFIEPINIGKAKATILVIHELFEDHDDIIKIVDSLKDELTKKYQDALSTQVVQKSKLAPLDTFIVDLFTRLKRPENPFACSLDE